MHIKESEQFVFVHSPFLAMTFAKRFPMIAQLGVESGGRLKRNVEFGLLKPGLGATSVCGGQSSFGQACELAQRDSELIYAAPADALSWRIAWPDERTCILRLNREGGMVEGEFFRIAFKPAISPPSVWGKWISDEPFGQYRKRSIFHQPDIVTDYQLPLFIHLPDFGGLSATCADPHVQAKQTFSADPTESGLNLGCENTYHHTSRVAYHHGTVTVSFSTTQPVDAVELVFRVEEEHYPQFDGADFSDPKWNGLKRCWQNAFTLNTESLSMGDNILLGGIAHLAVHFKSDMSVFTPPLMDGLAMHDLLRRALDITFRDCVGDNGEINLRYARSADKKPHPDFGFFDSNISNFIALYNYIAATDDWSVAKDNLPNILRAVRFLVALDRDGDGILELPYDGNAFRNDRECRNWWDNFSFGHKDAFVNLLAYRAFGGMVEILNALGETKDAAALVDLRSRFAANFHSTFFNDQTGVHAGWISADGRMHDYMFTFISSMAINEGLIDDELARRILNTLLTKLRAEGYGEWKWGIPGPLISVHESEGHIWDLMERWGTYENGGFCGQTAYHFIQALYRTGMRDVADEILFRMLDTFEHEFTHSGVFPGYLRSCDWRTREGIPCGYNYLADNYYFLLAGVTGHFGIPMPKVKPPAR